MTKTQNTTYSTFIAQCGFSYVAPHKHAIQDIAKRES